MVIISNKNAGVSLVKDDEDISLVFNGKFNGKDKIAISNVEYTTIKELLLAKNRKHESSIKLLVFNSVLSLVIYNNKYIVYTPVFEVLKRIMDFDITKRNGVMDYTFEIDKTKYRLVNNSGIMTAVKTSSRSRQKRVVLSFDGITEGKRFRDCFKGIKINGEELSLEELESLSKYVTDNMFKLIVQTGTLRIGGLGAFTYKEGYIKKNQYNQNTKTKSDIMVRPTIKFTASKVAKRKLEEGAENEWNKTKRDICIS